MNTNNDIVEWWVQLAVKNEKSLIEKPAHVQFNSKWTNPVPTLVPGKSPPLVARVEQVEA